MFRLSADLCCTYVRHAEPHQRSSFVWLSESQLRADQLCAFPHTNQADTARAICSIDSATVIFDLDFQRVGEEAQAYPRALCS